LIRYESRLELSRLLLLDFDTDVKAVSAQPFRLHFLQAAPKRSHVPDFFVQLANGRERVIDVKPARRLFDPMTRTAFAATQEACAVTGWDYKVLSEADPVMLANVRWLAGFRRPMSDSDLATRLLEVCYRPTPIGHVNLPGVSQVLVRPMLFRLLWIHALSADLTQPLTNATIVAAP
jgi:hypothetical protein